MASAPSGEKTNRDGAVVFVVALAARLAVVLWAAPLFPAAADGTYYERLAERLAHGLGYTWLWPDGAITYAAHYPVGYPAALAAMYAIAGTHVAAAMTLNAVMGALAAFAVHSLARRAANRRYAFIAGLLAALHPALVAYTPALMTEGMTAALLACAVATAARARSALRSAEFAAALGGAGILLGVATLVRPQTLLLAPILGGLVAIGRAADGSAASPRSSNDADLSTSRRRTIVSAVRAALVTTFVALAVCAPWTLRNCTRMGRCALVSVNGGWNLLIGADSASTGAWAPIQVPPACREVWDEAAKDECFGRAAQGFIAEHPVAWIKLAPSKLAATFDYCGAAGWYLHESNPDAFGEKSKIFLGVVETLTTRALLLAVLLALARRNARDESRLWARRLGLGVAAAGALSLLSVHGWLGYLALVVLGLLGARSVARGPLLVSSAVAVIAATMATHAVFFGSGRYSLVTLPLLCGLVSIAGGGSRDVALAGADADRGPQHRAA